jgi:very-short-patch-repair endonuclease
MPDAINAGALRLAIIEALYPISAHELADACAALGLMPAREGEDPFSSKKRYISTRLHGRSLSELIDLGQRIAEDYGDDELARVLACTGPQGVDGELKNLIFAADGPKPRIVLRDALNNLIEIVENEEYCLVYNRPLKPEGLTWGELTSWWADREGSDPAQPETRRRLYRRLRASLSDNSPGERVLFDAYKTRYRRDLRGVMPALIPQVYLHYDPYTLRELAVGPGQTLVRQRMDFLLLLPNRARVVLEVDGKQHYSQGGRANPERYAEMASEDRRLRLAGYEVYRFGAYELLQDDGEARASDFFDAVLARYEISTGLS